jgi:hypothetical protein
MKLDHDNSTEIKINLSKCCGAVKYPRIIITHQDEKCIYKKKVYYCSVCDSSIDSPSWLSPPEDNLAK